MKVLILSCNTGEGHNACAKAIQEALLARRIPCDIRDALGFVSRKASEVISQSHVWLYRNLPKLFSGGYSYAEKHPQTMDDDSAAYRFLATGAQRLRACVESQDYTDVICTHLFPAMMLTRIQRESPLAVRTAFVATDYTASPGCEAIRPDWAFIPHASLRDAFVGAGLPPERVVATGIPVRQAFHVSVDQREARRVLGMPPDHRHLLAMGGSMGCGPLRQILKRLTDMIDPDVEISVICGTNRKLSRQLNRGLGDLRSVHIHDYVDDVALYMASADLYLTKPGGISVSEAFARRLPMVLIQAVDGCERYNLDFALAAGAAVTAETPRDVAALCARLLRDPDRLAAMRDGMAALAARRPARAVLEHLAGKGTVGA